MLVIKLLLTATEGFVAHLTRGPVKRHCGAWGDVVSYVIGSLLALIQGLLIWDELNKENGRNRVIAAMALAYMAFGGGVVAQLAVLPEERLKRILDG